MVSVSPGGSGRAGRSGDCITLQRLESGAGFSPTVLSMLRRGLGNYLLHSEINYSGKLKLHVYHVIDVC